MPPTIHRNLLSPELVQWALKIEKDSRLTARGALAVMSYAKTGRSPLDKRIVDTDDVRENVDWGKVNMKLSEESFARVKKIAKEFLDSCEHLFVVDCFAGHDERYRLKVRVFTTRPYHALFMRDMLIVPTPEELATFGEPDYVIYNAGECKADPSIPGLTSTTCVALNFKTREQVILGTEYAGEMKKGILTVMFELMPRMNHLCMHASANVGKQGDVTVFFGLSGTGKTTLSADPHRNLIGDDEHVWTDRGVFNIEGGCYAKAIGLNPKTEKDIYDAVRFGAVAENCVLDKRTGEIDFYDESICKNTRVAYPLCHIEGALSKAIAGHPKNVIFLTNDAFGVMPPVARLTSAQAMFWFVMGYTANVPGVEAGGTRTARPIFSSCFGGPFLVRHATFYGEQLAEKMQKHNSRVWLLNTGYAGGRADRGAKRMPLRVTRAIIDAIHDGTLDRTEYEEYPGWGLHIPKYVAKVPEHLLNPRKAWKDVRQFNETSKELVVMFQESFSARFAAKASQEMKSAVPRYVEFARL
ncbi:Phosphoenolpyruvate carboxykinase [ATP], glycosomal [Trypanosoma cruzi]|nr:Phosphoenolpyruvate carboxykinase [ATP], glycosomal [Trypanosoma cruzi]